VTLHLGLIDRKVRSLRLPPTDQRAGDGIEEMVIQEAAKDIVHLTNDTITGITTGTTTGITIGTTIGMIKELIHLKKVIGHPEADAQTMNLKAVPTMASKRQTHQD